MCIVRVFVMKLVGWSYGREMVESERIRFGLWRMCRMRYWCILVSVCAYVSLMVCAVRGGRGAGRLEFRLLSSSCEASGLSLPLRSRRIPKVRNGTGHGTNQN